jgi:hypothetical protein
MTKRRRMRWTVRDPYPGSVQHEQKLKAAHEADHRAEDARRLAAEDAENSSAPKLEPAEVCIAGGPHLYWKSKQDGILRCQICCHRKGDPPAALPGPSTGWRCLAAHPEIEEHGRKRLSLCGNWTDPGDIVEADPSCPDCQAEQRRIAGEPTVHGDDDDFPF